MKKIYLAWDLMPPSGGDSPEVRTRISQALKQAASDLRTWAEAEGGRMVEEMGDRLILEVPSPALAHVSRWIRRLVQGEDLPRVGVGQSPTEADAALGQAKAGTAFVQGLELRKATSPPAKPVEAAAGQAEHSQAQNVYDVLNDEDRPPPPEQTHAERDFLDRFRSRATKPDEQAAEEQAARAESEGLRRQLGDALDGIRHVVPVLDSLRSRQPSLYRAIAKLVGVVASTARRLLPPRIDPSFEQTRIDATSSPLKKFRLPAPDPRPHPPKIVLPVGTQLDGVGKVKVRHQDGTTSWRQMRSGKILSQDPTGHPTSSRTPGAK